MREITEARIANCCFNGINIGMSSQDASLLNLGFVVAAADLRVAVDALHKEFFTELDPEVFD